MSIKSILLIVLLSSLVLFAAAYAVLAWIGRRQRQDVHDGFYGEAGGKRVGWRGHWNRILQQSYVWMVRVPLLSAYIRRIRKRLAIHAYDEFRLRHETAQVTLAVLGLLSLSACILLLLNPSVSFLLLVLLTAVILNSLLVDMYANRLEKRLLVQMVDLFSEVRHRYQQHEMIDEALYEAAETAKLRSGDPHSEDLRGVECQRTFGGTGEILRIRA